MENHLKTFAQGKLKYLFLLISLAMEIGTDIAHVLRSLLTIIFLVVYKEFQITGRGRLLDGGAMLDDNVTQQYQIRS